MDFDDAVRLRLGRIGTDRPVRHALHDAIRLGSAAPARSRKGGGGRGAGLGAALGSRLTARGARRCVVKVRIVKLGARGLGAARAHLRYLQREGTTREGERAVVYGPGDEPVDDKAFLHRAAGDRHQFRFIVAPEDGVEYDALKPLVRRLMHQAEIDLGTRLDWIAVDHFNTGHPHAHILLRGKDDKDKDLVIGRDYLTKGLRERASALVTLDLGPRSERDIWAARSREVAQERFTDLDRRLLRAADEDGIVRAAHANRHEQALRAARLQTLKRLDLASEVTQGGWRLDEELEGILKRMGERGDIIRTLQRAVGAHRPERLAADFVIHDHGADPAQPLIGRVVARGLSDEHADRHYLVIEGVDGCTHYLDIGVDHEPLPEHGIFAFSRRTATPISAVDRAIAQVAQAHGGWYARDIHAIDDPALDDLGLDIHEHRVERLAQSGLAKSLHPGIWEIAPDHLARIAAEAQRAVAQRPVEIRILADRPLKDLVQHEGRTWLDTALASAARLQLGDGLGAEVDRALRARTRWLVEHGHAQMRGDIPQFAQGFADTLQAKELGRLTQRLGQELQSPHAPLTSGDTIEGRLLRAVQVGDAKFAVVDREHCFSLVPWREDLHHYIGERVRGITMGQDITWTRGRRLELFIG